MKASHGFVQGLILLCVLQHSLCGGDTETYSMGEITEKGIPPGIVKRIDPQLPDFSSGNMLVLPLYRPLPGRVIIDFVIDEQGRVRNPRAVEYSDEGLVRPAMEAIVEWRYEPGKLNGKPVNVATMQGLGTGELARAIARYARWRTANLVVLDRRELPPELQWEKTPVLFSATQQVYPRIALQARKEGSAKIKFVVGGSGRVVATQVMAATTSEMGQAALAAVETWVFTPPEKKDGVPCSALLVADVSFRFFGKEGAMVSQETRKAMRLLEKGGGKLISADKLDRPLKPVLTRNPEYPLAMLKNDEIGQVEVDIIVDSNGEVQLPIAAPGTPSEFGYAAVQAVATWRFDVPRMGGKPVATTARVPVLFKKPAAPAEEK